MNSKNGKLPASFRIFGYGKDVEPVIESLSGMLPVGVEVEMMKGGEYPEPTDYDKMAIFLMSDHLEETCNASHTFYQADALSLIIHTPEMEFVPGACDGSMEAGIDDMQQIVLSLIAPLLHQGPVNYDFHDLRSLLGSSGYFRVWTSEGNGKTPLRSALEKINAEVSSYFKMESERLTILLSCCPSSASNLKMSEMECLADFISGFNDGINAGWGFYIDPDVTPGNIRVTVIITGQNIQYDD